MLRKDFILLVPALLVALYQVIIVWSRLPKFEEEDTETSGAYNSLDSTRWDYLQYLTYYFFIFQLVFNLLPITEKVSLLILLRVTGYTLIFIGLPLSLSALKVLGSNWSEMTHYRIKKEQKLITHGPYKFVRHPIYLAVILECTGFELVANSWSFLPMFSKFGLILSPLPQGRKTLNK